MHFNPVACITILTCAIRLGAQIPIAPDLAAQVNSAMDHDKSKGDLACHTQVFQPFLDFALRFESGFLVTCKLAQFEGQGQELALYLRVSPESGPKSTLAERLPLPDASPESLKHIHWNHFRDEIQYSGAVGLGTGQYTFDLLLQDRLGRTHRKQWRVRAEPKGKEKEVRLSAQPNSVLSVAIPPWHHLDQTNSPDRTLTVLLNAAPLFPYAQKMRAWDRAFLLGSLASLLGQTNARHVRVIAFNLDQQRQVFRDDHFDRSHFEELANALQSLELGTVNYRTLQHGNGWADLLVGLLNEEWNSNNPSDAVVFLGPNSRFLDKIEPAYLKKRANLGPRLFYFEYFTRLGYEFPDTIHQMTNACRGTVFKLHSPAEFAVSINKLERKLNETGDATP